MKTDKEFIKKLNEPITQRKLTFADWFTLFLLLCGFLGIIGLFFLNWL